MIARIHGINYSVLFQIHGREAEINSKLHEIALNILSDRADTLEKFHDGKSLQSSRGQKEALAIWYDQHTPYVVSFLHIPEDREEAVE